MAETTLFSIGLRDRIRETKESPSKSDDGSDRTLAFSFSFHIRCNLGMINVMLHPINSFLERTPSQRFCLLNCHALCLSRSIAYTLSVVFITHSYHTRGKTTNVLCILPLIPSSILGAVANENATKSG